MAAVTMGLVVCAALVAAQFALGMQSRVKARRTYEQVVGRDLAGLVALLPPELRDKDYASFMLAPGEAGRLAVGLVYHTGANGIGNPPNVGMEFDANTGALLRVHTQGIGLGIK